MHVAKALLGCLLAYGQVAALQWAQLVPDPGAAPAVRELASVLYDPVGRRLIVFGGQTYSGDLNDVWAFDLDQPGWTNITPASGPAPVGRFTHNAVYDHANRRMLVWSGQGSGAFLNDVWAFDLEAHTWSAFAPPPPMPNIRYGTAAVFDPIARHLVTYAGFTDQGRFGDVWRFDADGVAWTDVTPAGGGPGVRCLHSASRDIRDHRMIMYGGQRSGPLGDLWALDLASGQWSELAAPGAPPGRFFATQAYDSIRHRVLIFGGNLGSSFSNEVWTFDLDPVAWQVLTPTGSAPSPRQGATATYIVEEDRLVVFGGNASGFLNNDVWSLSFTDGDLVFPWPVLHDGQALRWTVPANVEYVRGDLASVGDYVVDNSGSLIHAASLVDPSVPAAGQGYYYLLRLQGTQASWQTTPGAEPDRDALLP
jgi:hypothetical protein